MPINIAIVDDHKMNLKSMADAIDTYLDFVVTLKANSGKDLQNQLRDCTNVPHICLLDVSMPDMDGPEVATWLCENHPAIKIIALSMYSEDRTIVRMMKAGCCCYMLKDMEWDEIIKALHSVHIKGYYLGDANYTKTGETVLEKWEREMPKLTEQELIFIKLAATDYTYRASLKTVYFSQKQSILNFVLC